MLSIGNYAVVALFIMTLASCSGQPGKTEQRTDELTKAAMQISPPDWYGVATDMPGTLTGFGSATTLEEAKKNALTDISQRLDVTVTSQTKQQTTVDVSGQVAKQASTSIKLDSSQRLKHASIIKQERSSDGLLYIAMRADFRLAEQILADRLRQNVGHDIGQINWLGSAWLVRSDFMQKVAQYAISSSGGPSVDINTELARESDHWVLALNNTSEIIESTDLPRLIAWKNSSPDSFTLDIRSLDDSRGSHRLKAGDRFVLQVKSKQSGGFYTLFNVYPDGRLTAIMDSQPLQVEQEFPDKAQQEQGLVLVAETLQPDAASHDVMLAIKTEQAVNTSMFQQADENLANDNAFKIHELLQWLSKTPIADISVYRLEIQPR